MAFPPGANARRCLRFRPILLCSSFPWYRSLRLVSAKATGLFHTSANVYYCQQDAFDFTSFSIFCKGNSSAQWLAGAGAGSAWAAWLLLIQKKKKKRSKTDTLFANPKRLCCLRFSKSIDCGVWFAEPLKWVAAAEQREFVCASVRMIGDLFLFGWILSIILFLNYFYWLLCSITVWNISTLTYTHTGWLAGCRRGADTKLLIVFIVQRVIFMCDREIVSFEILQVGLSDDTFCI